MDELSIEQIDYRYLLVNNYKSMGLSEYDLVTLLLIDNILKKEKVLITAELLTLKMNISVDEIDALLVSLTSRGFVEYVNDNNSVVTSLKPTYKKIIELFKSDIIYYAKENSNKTIQDETSNMFLLMQNELGRTLTPIEIEKVRDWINQGIKENVVLDCIHEVQNKSKKVTVNQIDKAILKYVSSRDIEKEGYSSVNEKWKKDLEETMKIANTRWTDKDE